MRMHFPAWSSEMHRLRNELDEVFGSRPAPTAFQSHAFPPLNLWEDDANFYVESEPPGVELDELELFVNDDNQLTMQAEHKSESGNGKVKRYGKLYRSIPVPRGIEAVTIDASYKNGVLEVHLPKGEEAKTKRIAVKAT